MWTWRGFAFDAQRRCKTGGFLGVVTHSRKKPNKAVNRSGGPRVFCHRSLFPAARLPLALRGQILRAKFTTSDLLYWQAVIAVIITQFVLCYGAITYRGYPPMTEKELYSMLSSPLLVWIPAVFGTRVNRMRGVMVMSISLTFFLTLVYIDDDIRPSMGHLGGPIGIIKHYFIQLVFMTILTSPLTFVGLYFFERVAGDIWRAVCFLTTERLTFSETWTRIWGRRRPQTPT